MDTTRLIADRAMALDASGIRRVFELGASLKDPVNLSIGQPDFPAPEAIKDAACDAIRADHNGYTLTQGIAPLRDAITAHLKRDIGWDCAQGDPGLIVTSGTSGALLTAAMAILNPGDEMIVADPFFLLYTALGPMTGATVKLCDTYPDFALTAERVEPLINERTKAVLLNSPSNPAGVVTSSSVCADLLDLCRRRGVLLISDEIYDEFTFLDHREPTGDASIAGGQRGELGERCPSPCRVPGAEEDVLLIRGFGKSYGLTGWRLGYAAGPAAVVQQMAKLQQYTYVCAPAPLQHAAVRAFDVDMTPQVKTYQARRDRVLQRLRDVTEVTTPGGAFYAFVRIPESLGVTGQQFMERCIERELLIIPGSVFSSRDSHFRLSFAASDEKLERGLDILVDLMS